MFSFQGISALYQARRNKRLNTSRQKQPLSQEARDILLKSFKQEYDLYSFIRQRLAKQMSRLGIKVKKSSNKHEEEEEEEDLEEEWIYVCNKSGPKCFVFAQKIPLMISTPDERIFELERPLLLRKNNRTFSQISI